MRTPSVTIRPAIMADEWSTLVAQIERLKSVSEYMHIDVMDGILVPSKSFPYNESIIGGKVLPRTEDIQFSAHLMVYNPLHIGEQFIKAGCTSVIAQIEGFSNDGKKREIIDEGAVRHALRAWRTAGAKYVGLSIMLETPLDTIVPFLKLKEIEMIQVMSIDKVGYQGEEFDERALIRIRALKTQFPHVTIAIDGGINEATINDVVLAGAHIVSVGSAISHSDDPQRVIKKLQHEAEI